MADDRLPEVADDAGKLVEIRFLCPADHVAVMDAMAFVNGSDRATEMRALLKAKHDSEVHRSTVLLRMLRRNPLLPEGPGRAGTPSGARRNDNPQPDRNDTDVEDR